MTELIQSTDYVLATEQSVSADVAADIGNARAVILVRIDGDDVPTERSMPAVRTLHGAFSWEVFAARGLPAASWSALKHGEHVIEREGVERFVGRLAVESASAASSGRGSDARYYDGTTLDFILAGVASALPRADKVTIRLVTMLPIALWHLAPRVESALRGRHTFSYNGRSVEIRIVSVVVKREGEAAFAAIDGDTSGPIVVIDGGGRTVNIALFRDGAYRSGTTRELGVQAALDNLDKALLGRGARALSLAERDDLEGALIAGAEYAIIANGERVRVDDLARIQLDATAHALAQELESVAPLGQARRIVLVGGASHAALFGRTIKTLLPRVETVGLRELANVYGALGAAQPAKKARKR